jgi:NADPH:quinone reductase-like Zn-dependent oxidoreductase
MTHPENMTFAMAAAMPLVGLTALQALEGAEEQVRANRCRRASTDISVGSKTHSEEGGEGVGVGGLNVLVLGASGGTGHVALQVAKARGHRVTAVCGSRNREWVDSLGKNSDIMLMLSNV